MLKKASNGYFEPIRLRYFFYPLKQFITFKYVKLTIQTFSFARCSHYTKNTFAMLSSAITFDKTNPYVYIF